MCTVALRLHFTFLSDFSACERLVVHIVLRLLGCLFGLENAVLFHQAILVALSDQFSHFVHGMRQKLILSVKVRLSIRTFPRMLLPNIDTRVLKLIIMVLISLRFCQDTT